MRGMLRLLSLFFIMPFLIACGKKAEPSYKKLIIPRAVSGVNYLIRPEGVKLFWQYQDFREGIHFEIYRKGADGLLKKTGETEKDFFNDSTPFTGEAREYVIVTVSAEGFKKEQMISIPSVSLPEAPELLSFRITDDGVQLFWRHTEGCLYNLYKVVGGEEILYGEPLNDTFFEDHPDPLRVQIYRVRCKRDSVEGYPAEVTVKPEDYIPSKPEGLRYVLSDGMVILTWREVPEKWIKGYRIYRSCGGEFTPQGESFYPFYSDEPGDCRIPSYRITAIGPSREGPFSGIITISR